MGDAMRTLCLVLILSLIHCSTSYKYKASKGKVQKQNSPREKSYGGKKRYQYGRKTEPKKNGGPGSPEGTETTTASAIVFADPIPSYPSKRKHAKGEELTMDELTNLFKDMGKEREGGKGGEGHSAPKNICGDDAILYQPLPTCRKKSSLCKEKKGFHFDEEAWKRTGEGRCTDGHKRMPCFYHGPQTQKCVS